MHSLLRDKDGEPLAAVITAGYSVSVISSRLDTTTGGSNGVPPFPKVTLAVGDIFYGLAVSPKSLLRV
jgi:hypothetical protein